MKAYYSVEWADDLGPKWINVDNMRLLCKEVDVKINELDFEIRLFRDGTSWCAVRNDFIDLQNSVCGFGNSPIDALIDLLKG